MADEQIKISIGAIENASVDRVFGNVRRKAMKAAQDSARAFARGSAEWVAAHEQVKSAASKAASSVAASAKRGAREEVSAAKAAGRERAAEERNWTNAFKAEVNARLKHDQRALKQRTAAHKAAMREQMREERRSQRAGERAASRAEGLRRRDASRTSHRATRFLAPNMPMASIGRRAAGDIARGFGVDMNAGSLLMRGNDLESQLTTLSNTSIIQGSDDVRNRLRIPVGVLRKTVQDVGASTGFDPAQVASGLNAYKEVTGDLATAMDILPSMMDLAATTGTAPEELMKALGEVGSNLRNVDPKRRTQMLTTIARKFAGQAETGAVELPGLARYGSAFIAGAGGYEGNIEETITELSALAQASRARGGSNTAGMAATSVARLKTTFSTPARVKAFKGAGIEVFDQGTGLVKDPIELIKQAVVATQNDPTAFNDLFKNVQGARPAEALRAMFLEARNNFTKENEGADADTATQAGLEAINKFFELQEKASLTETQIAERKREVEKTAAFQANKFNIEMDKVTEEVRGRLLPALTAAAPHIADFASAMGDLAVKALENPWTAVSIAIGASIARAGIETAFRSAIERAIIGGAPTIAAGAATGLSSVLGGALVGAAIAAAFAVGLQQLHTSMTGDNRSLFDPKQIAADAKDAPIMSTLGALFPLLPLATSLMQPSYNAETASILGSETAPGGARTTSLQRDVGNVGPTFGMTPFGGQMMSQSPQANVAMGNLKASIDALTAVIRPGLKVEVKPNLVPKTLNQ
jgi:hypothetical protein